LQEIDANRLKARQRLLEIQAALTESDTLKAAREALETTQASLKGWQAKQRDAELESQSLKAKIEENDRRLMRSTNPKEVESLQSNGESLRRHRATVEERGVEALLHVEELTAEQATRQETFSTLRAAWIADQQALISEGKKLQRKFAQMKEQRVAQAGSVDRADLAQYEKLRKRKAGVAVARISDDSCGACFVRLPTGIISSARTNNRPPFTACPSCGRILYAG
jgi:hypothetical protein